MAETVAPKDQASEAAEASLPKLKFTKIVRSSESLVKFEQFESMRSHKIEVIQPYGKYTLVLPEDSKELQILDENGELIKGLTNTNTMIVDWPALAKNRSGEPKYGYMTTDVSASISDPDRKTIWTDNLPESVRKAAEVLAEKEYKKIARIPYKAWQINAGGNSSIATVTRDGYVIFYQAGGDRYSGWEDDFIAFRTKNLQGADEPPRNWVRFDDCNFITGNADKFILKQIEFFRKTQSVYGLQLGNGFYVTTQNALKVLESGEKPESVQFTDNVAGIADNICEDPKNKGVVYYCSRRDPQKILKLDTNKDRNTWQAEELKFPQSYGHVFGLQMDPTGNFFMFDNSGEFVILTKDTLREVQRVPNLYKGKLDEQGRIRGIDEEGHLVIYEVNFQEVAAQAKLSKLKDLTSDFFKQQAEQKVLGKADEAEDKFQHLITFRQDYENKFRAWLETITVFSDQHMTTEALAKFRSTLATEGERTAEEIAFLTEEIEKMIRVKQQELAAPIVAQGLAGLGGKLSASLTVALLSEAREDLARLKSLEGFVDAGTREKIIVLEKQLGTQSAELFKTQGEVIGKGVNDLVEGVRSELDKMDNAFRFADWEEFTLPQLVGKLGALARDCPLEANELQQRILDARRKLQDIDREYGIKFKEQYAEVRQRGHAIVSERIGLMRADIGAFAERLRTRGFKDRAQAETYASSSETLGMLKSEIAELEGQDPDAARELDRTLKVQIANIMFEIERSGLTTIAGTGQQMERFGNTLFPRWEGEVRGKVKRQVDIIFIPDEKSKGPGVTADKILGDVGIIDINSRGRVEKRRLYEGLQQNEDARRYGNISIKGLDIFPSYVSNAEFKQIRKEYADWDKGGLKKQLGEKRRMLKDMYEARQKIGKRDAVDIEWKEKYKESFAEYAKFAQEHHVVLLERIDQLRNAPETAFANGSGYVPKWSSHWVKDEQTEQYLEKMAQYAKMQLDLQEGLLLLKGHAGAGKDVLVKMFCSDEGGVNRPYFSIDCSKWTTEFELSEDVILEAEDGASKTVKIPSVVLNAITTPGAIMYFNEINAMPEQAQIFLHGLMDEKRTLTLKTSSGKAIKAVNSVLLMGSMNPGYPGTFNPGFATKSRMMNLEIDYPPLYKEKNNPNSPISASEALRIARGVDSLSDFTYEANPQHNEFVKIWDKYINGVQNGAPELTKTQEFDVNVILSLVQFGNKLREGFILKFEKAGGAATKGKLLVDQPITGREMRRCAYDLSKMPENAKVTGNPEEAARDLLEKFFLSHIDKKDEREEIRRAMKTWTSSKKVASN